MHPVSQRHLIVKLNGTHSDFSVALLLFHPKRLVPPLDPLRMFSKEVLLVLCLGTEHAGRERWKYLISRKKSFPFSPFVIFIGY